MLYMNLDTVNALTTATPTAAELRIRVTFWRKFAGTIDCVDDKTTQAYELVSANCSDMSAAADVMDARTVDGPAPAAAPPPAPAKVRPARKAPAMTAEQFWTLQGAAVQAIRAECGDRWYLTGETVTGSIPAKLRSMIGPLGGKITWRRDHRFPAAKYWPDATIPADVILAPEWVPSADFYAPERDIERRVREAREEQIKIDRALTLDKRVDAAIANYWRQLAKLDSASDGMLRAAYIKSVNAAADAVIALFPVDDAADTIEQESRDDMDAERAAEISADEFAEQEAAERAARLEAERFTAECEAAELARAKREAELQATRATYEAERELARLVRQAEHDDCLAAERVTFARIDAEKQDALRVELARQKYVAWWRDALDIADVNASIDAARKAAETRAEQDRAERERLALMQSRQEAAEVAARKVNIERIARATISQVQAGRTKRPPVSNAFNAGRAAFLASLQDSAA